MGGGRISAPQAGRSQSIRSHRWCAVAITAACAEVWKEERNIGSCCRLARGLASASALFTWCCALCCRTRCSALLRLALCASRRACSNLGLVAFPRPFRARRSRDGGKGCKCERERAVCSSLLAESAAQALLLSTLAASRRSSGAALAVTEALILEKTSSTSAQKEEGFLRVAWQKDKCGNHFSCYDDAGGGGNDNCLDGGDCIMMKRMRRELLWWRARSAAALSAQQAAEEKRACKASRARAVRCRLFSPWCSTYFETKRSLTGTYHLHPVSASSSQSALFVPLSSQVSVRVWRPQALLAAATGKALSSISSLFLSPYI